MEEGLLTCGCVASPADDLSGELLQPKYRVDVITVDCSAHSPQVLVQSIAA
jgi:hypothetical protein